MANNISDMMDQFSDMMGNNGSSVNENKETSSSFDASKISPEMLKSFANMFNSSSSNGDKSSSTIDVETIMKLKNFMDQANNKNNPDSNLLSSLKPYLKESRKNKVDQYIGLLNMSKAMNLFGNFRWW